VNRPLRLIGLGVSNLAPPPAQLKLPFENPNLTSTPSNRIKRDAG
jgi:hypothetical protein